MYESQVVSHRILIAGESEFLAVAAREAQFNESYVCDTVTSAESFMDKLREADFRLAVVDSVILSDAQDLAPVELRKLAAGVPIILILSERALPSRVNLADLSVRLVLGKSISPGELKMHIQSLAVQDLSIRVERPSAVSQESVSALSPDALVDLTCQSISQSLLNLRQLAQRAADEREAMLGHQDVCRLFHCPRLNALTVSMIEAIDVLEQTKNSFKSRELGELRKRLQTLVRQAAVGSGGQVDLSSTQGRLPVMPGMRSKGGNE